MKMWRFGATALLALLLVVLAACGRSAGTGGTTAQQPTPSCTSTAVATPTVTVTVTPTPTQTPERPTPAAPSAPRAHGQVILIDLERQWLYGYEEGKLVLSNAVESGRPELPTPTGTFSILRKARDITFVSPWPKGSPYYYEPTHINYAMEFKEGGYYLHDAWWHVLFGPGSNVPHQLPDGRWETGSHGCVGMPLSDAKRLYEWVRIGTPVIVVKRSGG